MYHKIAQLILTPGKNASSTSDIFIAQPDSAKESLAGKLFILADIASKNSDNQKIIAFLTNYLNDHYYQNEKIILRERIAGLSVEHIFESVLARANAEFPEFLNREKIRINLSSINLTVGVIHDDTLYFANTGKNNVFLVYRRPADTITHARRKRVPAPAEDGAAPGKAEDEYAITDIAQQGSGLSGAKNDSGKIFSNVTSGQIPAGSCFFITSESLPEYITNRQIIEILTTLPPSGAMEQIKNILADINAYVSFLGIIIKSSSPEKPATVRETTRVSSSDSISSLNATEDVTEELLAPSGLVNLRKWTKNLGFLTSIFGKKGDSARKNTFSLKDKLVMRRNTFVLFRSIKAKAQSALVLFLNILALIVRSFKNRKNTAATAGDTGVRLAETLRRQAGIFARLSKKTRILISALLVLVIVFTANILLTKQQNNSEENVRNIIELSALIEQKQNQAEADILYNNESGAKKLFTEIEELMKDLPNETDEEKRQIGLFRDKLESQLEKIRRVTRIEAPAQVADFKNLNSQAKPENIIFFGGNKRIYAADSADNSIYILNTNDKLITTLTDLNLPQNQLVAPVAAGNGQIYYLGGDAVVALDTSKETLNAIPFEAAAATDSYVGADIYNNRIYYLNRKEDGQIHRYAISDTRFSAPETWFGQSVDLGRAVDLSIDGNIFILFDDGTVKKYQRGQETEFKLTPADPPFEQPAKIHVSPDQDHIYILEPVKKRLLLYGKDGGFQMQYYFESLDQLKDFIVDEENSLIYLLNGAAVYSIPLD